MKKLIKNNDGYFLMELILIIVVVSLCILPISGAIGQATQNSIFNEESVTKTNLAEQIMESMMNKTFTGCASISQTSFPSPFTNYNYTVSVNYVNSSDLDTPVVSTTEYKRILVSVSDSHGNAMSLVGLKTDYLNLE